MKSRLPKVGEQIEQNGIQYKVENECLGIYYGRKKFARELTELDLTKIIYLTEPKKKKIKPPAAIKFTKDEIRVLLGDLVEADSLRVNFKREIILLYSLIRKFPHREFWLEGFKPALKVNSLIYWLNRQEVENLYKIYSINLTSKVEEVKLEDEKIGEDLVFTEKRKPRTLLELLK